MFLRSSANLLSAVALIAFVTKSRNVLFGKAVTSTNTEIF